MNHLFITYNLTFYLLLEINLNTSTDDLIVNIIQDVAVANLMYLSILAFFMIPHSKSSQKADCLLHVYCPHMSFVIFQI